MKKEEIPIKPFLKWAGGKFRVLDRLNRFFPIGAKRFVEPFIGAGAIALNVEYPDYIISDANADLILVWSMLQEMGKEFIQECEALFTPANNHRKSYDNFRREFNTTTINKIRKASLFVYLNRHCFNGLCRYNRSNEFNVPFGKYDKPYFPRRELEKALKQTKKFQIHNEDFRKIFDLVEDGDVVYCDPPYMPLSTTSSFSAYMAGGFSLQDHMDLACCAETAAQKGATVIITNHYNWYSVQLYKHHHAKTIKMEVSRTISSKTDKRHAVDEIIAVFEGKRE